MAYRIGFYTLVLAVALLGAMGLGFLEPGGKRGNQGQSQVAAAPLRGNQNESDNEGTDNDSGDNEYYDNYTYDNGYDNGSSDDNGGSDDNGSFDNDDFGSGSGSTSRTPTPEVTATRVPAVQPPPPPTTSSGPCSFVLGFADLHRILNGRDGTCLTNEFPDPNGTGDQLQLTSLPAPNGLMVWNRFTNSMRWTDGFRTWTYSKCLLQERLNTEVFAWELNPSLLVPESAPVPPGACDVMVRA